MTDQQQTPLPWEAEQGNDGLWHIKAWHEDLRVTICAVYGDPELGHSTANARYIVRACNLFPQLVEALERCGKAFVAYGLEAELRQQIGEAIALAKGMQ